MAILCLHIVKKNILNQMKELLAATHKLANGELNFKVNVYTKHEIGQTFEALNNAVESLKNTVGVVKQESSTITKGTSGIERAFANVSNEFARVSASTQEISQIL